MLKFGIYKITNIFNGKVYIGQVCSTQGFNKRWNNHKSCLRRNACKNKHLQAAYNKANVALAIKNSWKCKGFYWKYKEV